VWPRKKDSLAVAPLELASLKLDDPINKRFVNELKIKNGITTISLSSIDPNNYSVIFFAGGHGTMWDFPMMRTFSESLLPFMRRGELSLPSVTGLLP
jgi:putative intracellular protease/amidase